MRQARGHMVDGRRSAPVIRRTRAVPTGDVDARAAGDVSGDVDTTSDMFGDVSPTLRLQMELIARSTSSPEEALASVINLIVEGSPQKRAAIVTAISENDPLREQWERTWTVLRH